MSMFYGASKEIRERAKKLRKNSTKAEELLWEVLRNEKLSGLKFRRQHPVENYIVDFYCHSQKLAIEVDGPVHDYEWSEEYDIKREQVLKSLDIKVIRFKNEEVLKDLNFVINKIKEHIKP
jgi:very-short-patch-repair endonuclease